MVFNRVMYADIDYILKHVLYTSDDGATKYDDRAIFEIDTKSYLLQSKFISLGMVGLKSFLPTVEFGAPSPTKIKRSDTGFPCLKRKDPLAIYLNQATPAFFHQVWVRSK